MACTAAPKSALSKSVSLKGPYIAITWPAHSVNIHLSDDAKNLVVELCANDTLLSFTDVHACLSFFRLLVINEKEDRGVKIELVITKEIYREFTFEWRDDLLLVLQYALEVLLNVRVQGPAYITQPRPVAMESQVRVVHDRPINEDDLARLLKRQRVSA